MHNAISLDADTLKSLLRLMHFFGLVLGLGTATFLDLMLVRFMLRGRIRKQQLRIFTFGSHAVTVGLVLLWISGAGFLWMYSVVNPTALTNPKIWAKITIVWVLTINAVYLHLLVLPIFQRQAGKPLLAELSHRDRAMMVIGGVTSALSWYFPLAIAAQSWLNFSASVAQIVGSYAAVLSVGLLVSLVAGVFMARHARRLHLEPAKSKAPSRPVGHTVQGQQFFNGFARTDHVPLVAVDQNFGDQRARVVG
jgi:hypothetical protein